MIGPLEDMALAMQFMTRVPIRFKSLDAARLNRASAWFPMVGLFVGGLGAICYRAVVSHLGRSLTALVVVLVMIVVTGGLHEDGLADCADAFGGGWTREDRLRILKDSRIGSFGAIALVLSLGARVLLLATLPAETVLSYLVSAQVLARWTPLPLGAVLRPARGPDGQGGRIAGRTSWFAFAIGSVLALAPVCYLLRLSAWQPVLATLAVTVVSGLYYQRRIGGVTGDCMGATIQISEIAVYLCGAWMR
ncbi:MAG: adenosylcobinamide-GDP ribazoletransferase [Acidobacteriota bacterium]|nr:adenosylcobinamide-GDP ribazoletransferase [Acidobacteriota bacterium]